MSIPSTMHYHDGELLTKYSTICNNLRYASIPDESVKINHVPLLENYRQFLEEKKLEESRFSHSLKEYEKSQFESTDLTFISYLQYLSDQNMIAGDREFYSHIIKVFDFLEFENFIHPSGKKILVEYLTKNFYSTNAKYKKTSVEEYKKLDYSKFYDSNSKKTNTNQVLNELYAGGGELYIDNKGKYWLRLTKYHEIVPYTKTVAEDILTLHFGFKIKITDTPVNYKDIDIDDFIFKTKVIEVSNVE